jgi:pimeloyl-ACP methyl ester carboxylesterase
MNKLGFLLLFLTFLCLKGISQINSIGHRTVTFNDPTRTGGYGSGGGSGRQIQTEIYYPSSAATDGDSTTLAPGQYPILIFGHGFVMDWSAYDNIWKDLVPQGYIMCFPRTEGSISPSHTDFGKDLALLQSKMLGLNSNPVSPFFNSMANKTAIMGHSMGGGSSFLACAGNSAPTTMVTFAAANTNPSSIAAATQVTIPTLVLAGQNDCIAPPPANQDSMYLKCAAACKAEVTIKGASHCGFADFNTNCSLGQTTCSPQPTITGAQQHTIASVYYSYWLKYWLKNDCASWDLFSDSLNNATNINHQMSCSITCVTTGIAGNTIDRLKISPNPTQGLLYISLEENEPLNIEIYDALGRKIDTFYLNDTKNNTINMSKHEKGIYFLLIKNESGYTKTIRFIKD